MKNINFNPLIHYPLNLISILLCLLTFVNFAFAQASNLPPRIALYPLNYDQYQHHHSNGEAVSELVSSFLMIQLGSNLEIEIIDRSMTSALFSETSSILSNGDMENNPINKLPISNYSLTGSLSSTDGLSTFQLNLIQTSTGRILGASRFPFDTKDINPAIKLASNFVHDCVAKQQRLEIKTGTDLQKIAFGHFIDINNNDSALYQGRDISDKLIESFVNNDQFLVLARTNMLPLIFEEYLKILQYTDKSQIPQRDNSEYIVYGYYKYNPKKKSNPISIYIYIDLIKYGRKLRIVNANNWDDAFNKVNSAVTNFLPSPFEKKKSDHPPSPDFNFSLSIFDSIVSREKAKSIFEELIRQEFLIMNNDSVKFNYSRKSNELYNYPHKQILNGFDTDISIQIFEKLRSTYFWPLTQISYIKPKRRYHPRDAAKKRSWKQKTVSIKHNDEAVIYNGLAKSISNAHINKGKALPYFDFYPEAQHEGAPTRKANLKAAVDGFASSTFLELSYLESMIFLGHLLCQKEVGKNQLGKMLQSWVVDHTLPVHVKSYGGMYFYVGDDVEEKDHLIFVAADAVNRVKDAHFSKLFLQKIDREEYFIKKSTKNLNRLEAQPNNPDSDADAAKKEKIRAYADLIREQCRTLSKNMRKIRHKSRYKGVESIADLALGNKKLEQLVKESLKQIKIDYPQVYPYVIINTVSDNPLIFEAQFALLDQTASGELDPFEPTRFMEQSLKRIFSELIKAKDIQRAKQFIKIYLNYFGLSDKTVIDFASLYHVAGDHKKAEQLLTQYGKNSFTLSDAKPDYLNGIYKHSGFDKYDRLMYKTNHNQNVFLVYKPVTNSWSGMINKPYKWRLLFTPPANNSKKNQWYYCTSRIKERPLFTFGYNNSKAFTATFNWNNDKNTESQIKSQKISDTTLDTVGQVELSPLSDEILSTPEYRVEKLFKDGYQFDSSLIAAIKGYPTDNAHGPIRDEYFSESFSRLNKINVVTETLYAKGYLSTNGIPKPHYYDTFSNNRKKTYYRINNLLRTQLKNDFPDYTNSEQNYLLDAFKKAYKVQNAGSVEIIEMKTISQPIKLIADNAFKYRHFGASVSVFKNHILIGDVADGLYHYRKIDGEWIPQSHLTNPSGRAIAMDDYWAAVSSSTGKVSIFKKDSSEQWSFFQTLKLKDYNRRIELRHNFEFFGAALAMTEEYLFIGNPYGGENKKGEIYIYGLENNIWELNEILIGQYGKGGTIGYSLSAIKNTLVAGNTGYPEVLQQTGIVFIYQKENQFWKLKKSIIQKDGKPYTNFGTGVMLKVDNKNGKTSVLIKTREIDGKNNVFSYKLKKSSNGSGETLVFQSGKGGFLSRPPHNTLRAGPHRALHQGYWGVSG
ncbi:MAG: hypothetical protein GY699_10780 [Desulfobacteraceae bacterium]|nr:hypothetical protein [Desulfobacteraceae bacterium]